MASQTRTLNARERGILHLIVRGYIENGEPVGSRTLSRMRDLALSPASIRNVRTGDVVDVVDAAASCAAAGRTVSTDAATAAINATVFHCCNGRDVAHTRSFNDLHMPCCPLFDGSFAGADYFHAVVVFLRFTP